ncbi:hypothetical protein GCM10010425_76540 [Streptomyces spororaveus]|uniref:Uncharacterized protein n=1 Tax=Streptomyces spororaveus TaxID=284039 RepID=A0ABQ3T3E2_9ACTN|nr:hypothetical protein Sspor_04720 [Streptomyces spororaveus]
MDAGSGGALPVRRWEEGDQAPVGWGLAVDQSEQPQSVRPPGLLPAARRGDQRHLPGPPGEGSGRPPGPRDGFPRRPGDCGIEIHESLFSTIVGGKITDIDQCTQDIDESDVFWS